MAKLKLLLPGGNQVSFENPFQGQANTKVVINFFVNLVSVILISLFAFLLPLSGNLFVTDTETSTLRFVLIFVFGFFVLFTFKLLTNGTKILIDPKGLLVILLFNLVLTVLSITISTIRVSSTFGTTGFRSLSGLALISLIGLFYFFNLYAVNSNWLRRTLDLFTIGTAVYLIYSLIEPTVGLSQLIANLPLIAVAFGFLIVRVSETKNKLLGMLSLLLSLILIFAALPLNGSIEILYFVITLFIASSLVLSLYILRTKKTTKARLQSISSNIKNFLEVRKISVPTSKGLADLKFVLMLLLPVFLLLSAVILYFQIPQISRQNVITDITSQYTEGFRLITGGSSTIDQNNLRSILMGVGNDNYNPSQSFLVNVLIVNGLIGFLIFISLWIYFIKIAKDLLLSSIKSNKNYKVSVLILVTVILIPLNLAFSYASLITVVLLWLVYAFAVALQSKEKVNYFESVNDEKSNRIMTFAKVVLAVAVVLAVIYLVNIIFGVLI